MKKFVLIASLLFSSSVYAADFTQYGDKQCEMSNAKVDIAITKDEFEPRIIYVQEGDKVCLKITALDIGVNFTIDGYPVMVSTSPNSKKQATAYFRATKVGEFKIRCRGGCAYNSEPKLVVQSKKDFQQWQEENYRKEAEKYRQKVNPDQRQRNYKSTDPTYNKNGQKPRTNNPYELQRYRSKYLDQQDDE